MTASQRWQKSAQLILFLSYLLVFPLGVVLYQSGFSVDTNIKSLSPDNIFSEELQSLLDENTSVAEKRVRFVFYSSSEYELEDALYSFEESLVQFNGVLTVSEFDKALSNYTDFYLEHAQNFVSEQDGDRISDSSTHLIFEEAKKKAYEIRSGFRFISIPEDPLEILNSYLSQLLEKISPEIKTTSNEGSALFVEAVDLVLVNPLSLSEQEALVGELNQLRTEIISTYSNVSVVSSGVLYFAEEAASSSKRDISVISTGSIIGTLLILWLIFRSFKPMTLPLISIASGVLSAFVYCSWYFGSIHVITIVFGASLIGVAVDYALHYYYFCSSSQKSKSYVFRALAFSLITSVVGYSALSFSGLPALKQVALFSIVGLVCSWLTVVSLGHFLFDSNKKIHDGLLKLVVMRTIKFFSNIPTKVFVLLSCGLALAFFYFFLNGLKVTDSPRVFFAFSDERIEQEKQVAALSSSFEPASFLLIEGETVDELYLNFEKVRQSLSNSDGFLGVDDFIPSRIDQKKNYDLNKKLADADIGMSLLEELGFSQEALQEYSAKQDRAFDYVSPEELFLLDDAGTPKLFSSSNDKYISLLLIPSGVNLGVLNGEVSKLAGISLISTVDAAKDALKALRESAMRLLIFACGFIALLILFRYRNYKKVSIVAVPVISILITVLAIQLSGGDMSLFHVMALFLVLGLGMDYVIFVEEMSSHLEDTLSAICLSSFTSLLSFGLLSLSSTPVVHAFGFAVLVGNSCNLLGSFILASRFARNSASFSGSVSV